LWSSIFSPCASKFSEAIELMERIMNRGQCIAIVTATAFSLALIGAAGSAAYAGPNVPRGHYCLSYDTGGSDCSFTSYSQCLATASGIDGECYGKTVRDDEQSQIGNSYARVPRPAGSTQTGDRARRAD
jgi:Protein of unknown function (DUF3551)